MSLDANYHDIKTVLLHNFYIDALCVAFFTSNILIDIKCDHIWQTCAESENVYKEFLCLQLLTSSFNDIYYLATYPA